MGSSFKDLVMTNPTVKMDPKSDKPFELQNILNFIFFTFNGTDINNFARWILLGSWILPCIHMSSRLLEFATPGGLSEFATPTALRNLPGVMSIAVS
jgi:hypothetical protein